MGVTSNTELIANIKPQLDEDDGFKLPDKPAMRMKDGYIQVKDAS